MTLTAWILPENLLVGNTKQDVLALSIGGSLIKPVVANQNAASGGIRCRSRLGGLLNFYYREAA